MKWKHTPPDDGEMQTRVFFAFFPRRGTDGYTYWLTRVREERKFYRGGRRIPYSSWERISLIGI